MIKTTIIFLFSIFVFYYGFGQQDQIIILGKGDRTIEPSYRIETFPVIMDSVKSSSIQEYPLLFFQVPTTIELDTIQRGIIENSPEILKALKPFYARLGAGTALMSLGELYFNSTRSDLFHYGIHAKHLSAFRTNIVKNDFSYLNSNFDNSNTTVFLNYLADEYKFKSAFKYSNNGFNYYGARLNNSFDSLINQSITFNKQRHQNLGGDISFERIQGDSAEFNFKIDAEYNYFFSKPFLLDTINSWNNREHYTHVNMKGWYKYQHEVFFADLGLKFNGYRQGYYNLIGTPFDTSFVTNNYIAYLSPGVRTQMFDDKLKVEIGAKIALDFYDKTNIYLYPKVEIKYSMFNDIFIPYIGIKGDLQQNTFRNFSVTNPFINVNQDSIINDNNLFSFHGGIKGVLSKEIEFNLKADFGRHIGYGLFIPDSTRLNTFKAVYDTISIMCVEGSISYTQSDKLNVEGIGRFNSYQTNNNAYAWNLPQFQFILRGKYNLYDKLYAQLDGELQFGRKSLTFDAMDFDGIEDEQYYLNLKPMIDLNLEAEYRYNNKVSVFLQLNNLVSVRYNRFYNYPVQGFQMMGGITYRF